MNRHHKITWSIIAIFFIISPLLQSKMHLSPEAGWHLLVTQRFLSHFTLPPISHANTLLLILIYSPSVLLVKLTGLATPIVFKIEIYGLILLSLWLSQKAIERLFPSKDVFKKSGLLIAISLGLLLSPAMEFGQYDHLFLILTLPYFLNTALFRPHQKNSSATNLWVGCFAGLGFLCNFTYFFFLAIAETVRSIKARSLNTLLRTDTVLIASILIFYLLCSFAIYPTSTHNILLHTSQLYPFSYQKGMMLFLNPISLTWVATAILLPLHYRNASNKLVLTIFFLLISFYFLQLMITQTVWHYQTLPALVFSFLVLSLYLLDDMKAIQHVQKFSRGAEIKRLCITVLTYAAIILFPIKDGVIYTRVSLTYRNDQENEINQLIGYINRHAQRKPIYVFNFSLDPSVTLAYHTNVKLVNTSPGFPLLRHLILSAKAFNTKKANDIRQKITNRIIQSLHSKKPDFVLVDTKNASLTQNDKHFRFIPYLSKDPRFKAIWKHYHFVYQINQFAIYKR